MCDEQQQAECGVIKYRADQAEDDHEAPDVFHVPSVRLSQHLFIHLVAGNPHSWEVGQKIVEQYLFCEQRQEGEEK
ncbi:hypothetical protein SDC9_163804 [bioreactor metagenome]|uniref:Uncharacterized protein n=1 Tax=bioreactor metagenome TaxID=1076179 RepID=A0A645FRE4_9ZZZZ